jgi:hypothetical protein
MEQALARELLGLPAGVPLLLFGAIGGGRDPRNLPDLGFLIHYTGHLQDDLSLRTLYSAADALARSPDRTLIP